MRSMTMATNEPRTSEKTNPAAVKILAPGVLGDKGAAAWATMRASGWAFSVVSRFSR